jgi:hypothetical protein
MRGLRGVATVRQGQQQQLMNYDGSQSGEVLRQAGRQGNPTACTKRGEDRRKEGLLLDKNEAYSADCGETKSMGRVLAVSLSAMAGTL